VAGMGGFYNLPGLKPKPAATPKTPASGTDASGNPLRLEVYNDNTFGFLRITISPAAITGQFITVNTSTGKTGIGDAFTVDLKANKVSSTPAKSPAASTSKSRPKPVPKKRK